MFDNRWPGGNSTARRVQIKVLQITSTYESVSVIFSFNTKALDLCGPFILAKRHFSLCGFDRRPTVVWLLRTFIDRLTFSGDRHRIHFVYFLKTALFGRIEIRILLHVHRDFLWNHVWRYVFLSIRRQVNFQIENHVDNTRHRRFGTGHLDNVRRIGKIYYTI